MSDIRNRYPELFEIFSEESKSQFSNLSQQSETEAPEKFVENVNCTFPNYFHGSNVYCEDAEVTSDKNSTFKPIMNQRFHQQSLGNIKKEVLPEKIHFSDFQNNPERLETESSNYESQIVKLTNSRWMIDLILINYLQLIFQEISYLQQF